MSNITLDGNKIEDLVSAYENSEELIAGSGQHLDFILELQRDIKKLTKLTINVNDYLENEFNSLDEAKANAIVIRLIVGVRNAQRFYRSLKKMHPSLYEGIKSCTKDLYIETKQVDEFIQDIIKYKIQDTSELRTLLQ